MKFYAHQENGLRRLFRFTWIKLVLLITFCLAAYEIHYIMVASYCSDEELLQSLTALCDMYKAGGVDGNICSALCDTREIHFKNCLNYRDGKRIVTASWHNGLMVLKSKHGYLHQYEDIVYTVGNVTYTPEVGEFNQMLLDTIKMNFDVKIPVREDIATRLWSKDFLEFAQKSVHQRQIAMRSLWSLIQQDEYLIFKLFDHVDYFPNILGTCGHYYGVEYAPPGPVLDAKPLSYSDSSPWRTRRDLALQFLELTRYLETNLDGKFNLCDIKPENFGLTARGDLKVIDVDLAMFNIRLGAQFDLEACRADSDCSVLDCRGTCNLQTKTCNKARANSNLQAVCDKVFSHRLSSGYRGLLRYPPPLLRERMDAALQACIDIDTSSPAYTHDQQEIIYWKIHNLLKKTTSNLQITDYVGF